MADPSSKSRNKSRVNGSKRQPDRAEKLSAQLRANLKRRKQQAKSRKLSPDTNAAANPDPAEE